MTTKSIYWITRLDALKSIVIGLGTIFSVVCVLSVFALIFSMLFKYANVRFGEDDCDYKLASKTLKISRITAFTTFIAAVMLVVGNAFIPSTKEYFVINTLPAVCSKANIDKATRIVPDALDAASDWLKSLKDVDNKKKK